MSVAWACHIDMVKTVYNQIVIEHRSNCMSL